MKENKITQQELEVIAQNLIEKWQKQGLNTELSIICLSCGNDVDLTGFLVHVTSSFLKGIWALLCKEFVIKLLKKAAGAVLDKLISKKGVIDTTMAQLANDFEMICPQCKAVPRWKEMSAYCKTPVVSEQEESDR